MKFWDIFKKKEVINKFAKQHGLYFLYEDYCHIFFSPNDNKILIEQDTEEELAFKSKQGIKEGSDNIYARKATQKKFKRIFDRKIPIQFVDELLSRLGFDRYEKVFRFSMHWEEEFRNTIGFELSGTKIFVEFSNGYVENLSIESLRPIIDEDKLVKFSEFFYEMGTNWNLILIDWISSKMLELNSRIEIEEYVKKDR